MDQESSAAFFRDVTQGSLLNQGHINAGNHSHIGDDPREYRDSLTTRKGPKVRGTCDWIFKRKAYLEWVGTHSLIWISGDPGKGKTMLALSIIKHRQTITEASPSTKKTIYFFCNSDTTKNSGVTILLGLIYQLLTDEDFERMFSYIQDAYSRYGSRLFSEDRFHALWPISEAMIRDPHLDSITCIIDGVDECVENTLSDFWVKIRSLFSASESDSNEENETKPEHHLSSLSIRLEPDLNRELQADVEKFIASRIDKLPHAKTLNPGLRYLISAELLKRANGTYLCASFAIGSLKSKKSIELEAAIQAFPRGLDAMYRRMLLEIDLDKHEIVVKIFRWVATAFRPLTLKELGIAVELQKGSFHTYSEAITPHLKRYSLLQYALSAGLQHITQCGLLVNEANIPHPLLDPANPKHIEWMRAQSMLVGRYIPPASISLLHMAALLGQKRLLDWSTSNKSFKAPMPSRNVEIPDEFGRVPLFYAAFGGHYSTVQYLIDRGANVNAADSIGQTALHISCALNHGQIALLLLESGANMNKASSAEGTGTVSMLCKTFAPDEDDEYKLSPEAFKINSTGTPLHLATEFGATSCVRVLLKFKIDINAMDVYGQTALHRVASEDSESHELICALLINGGANILLRNREGKLPIHVAVSYTSLDNETLEILKMFIDGACPVAILTSTTPGFPGGVTPLQLACKSGHAIMCQYLYEKGANVHHRDNSGRTALHWLCSEAQIGWSNKPYIWRHDLFRRLSYEEITATDSNGKTAYYLGVDSDALYHRGHGKSFGNARIMRRITKRFEQYNHLWKKKT
ncbi:hypothetical protein BDV95DRAFT_663982 [Massariosphaeria phaeospora]|uniref:Nephrocystin 3-like N-terminal domain-containing protein n=1 Tax=Massariosphaeria phaeospora TaxID=100035 RepID=A0A7C8ILG2_9PLEO|nr:hypothetical protein BDV95DRAFT_663982 [Massariosphaeria phaeospora]